MMLRRKGSDMSNMKGKSVRGRAVFVAKGIAKEMEGKK